MDHSVRTDFGEPSSAYGGRKWAFPLNRPPQGLDQGNGAASAMQAIVSTNFFNFLRDASHGAVFKFCISQESLNLVVYCFVDDSTII